MIFAVEVRFHRGGLVSLADQGGDDEIAADVQGGPAHVEKAVGAQDQADPFRGNAERLQEDHDQGQGSPGHAGRADARQNGHENDLDLLEEGQFNAIDLGEKQDRDAFEEGGAVLVGGGPR